MQYRKRFLRLISERLQAGVIRARSIRKGWKVEGTEEVLGLHLEGGDMALQRDS